MAIEKEKMMAKGRLGYLRLVREQMKARVTGGTDVHHSQISVGQPLTPAQRRWGKVRIFLRAGLFHSRNRAKKHESDSEDDIDHDAPPGADTKPAEGSADRFAKELPLQSSIVSRLATLSRFKSFERFRQKSPISPSFAAPISPDLVPSTMEQQKKRARALNWLRKKLSSCNKSLIEMLMSVSDSSLYAIPNVDHEGLSREFDSKSILALPAAIYWCAYSNTQYICYFLFMLRYLQLRSGFTVIYPLVTLVIAVPYHPRPPRWFWIGISAYSALTIVIGTILALPMSFFKDGCVASGAPLNGNTVSDSVLYSLSTDSLLCSASDLDLVIFAMCVLHISVIRRRGLWITELETRSGLEGPSQSLEVSDERDADAQNESNTPTNRVQAFDATPALLRRESTSRQVPSPASPADTNAPLAPRRGVSTRLSMSARDEIVHTDSVMVGNIKLDRQTNLKGPTKRRDKLAHYREKMKAEKPTGTTWQLDQTVVLFVLAFVEHLKGKAKLGSDLYTAMYTSQLVAFCNFVYVGFTMSSGGADISRNVIPLDTLIFPLIFFAVIVVDRYIYLKRNGVTKMLLHVFFALFFFASMQKGTFGSASSSYALYDSR
jgi:hypothetical protein